MDMESRVDKIEKELSKTKNGYIRFEGKIDLIVYQLKQLNDKDFITGKEVEAVVTKRTDASKVECDKKFVLMENYNTLWIGEYAKQQSMRSKVVRGFFFGLGVVITTIITILTGLADLMR